MIMDRYFYYHHPLAKRPESSPGTLAMDEDYRWAPQRAQEGRECLALNLEDLNLPVPAQHSTFQKEEEEEGEDEGQDCQVHMAHEAGRASLPNSSQE